MQCDISVFDFWNMTYGEIIDTTRAYSKKKENRLKEKAIMDYKLADLIATNVAALLSKEAKIPSLIETYEFLFQEEKKEQEEIKVKVQMEIWKQKMFTFSENHNRKWGENQ